jgi:glycosyltransferase involved in cell wall biosynthesis
LKILFFTRYTRLGASSRLRFYQFFPHLKDRKITIDVSPLFNEQYLTELYNRRGTSKWNIVKSYLKRTLDVLKAANYDLIVIEKELFPYFPATAEYLLSSFGVKYIVDYDDAIFHNYDTHPNKGIRVLLGKKIATVMRSSALVVAGNKYLHDYAVQSGAVNTCIIPTVIDTTKYVVKQSYSSSEIVIGWIGSPSTLKYIETLKPILRDLSNRYPIKLHIVGGKSGVGLGEMEEVLDWSEEGEVEMIRNFDIGIMPLQDELWEYGKCGYKLIQYMGCAIPVIGSPIGVNDVIIQEGVNGFKPVDAIGWKNALEALIVDGGLRQSMGSNGRLIVEENYSLIRARKDWYRLISEVAESQIG